MHPDGPATPLRDGRRDASPRSGALPGWGAMIASLMPDLRCHRCGGAAWDMAHPDDPGIVAGIVYHRVHDLAADGYTACVPLICARCGGVEMFSKDHLTRWWRDRQV